MDIHTFIEKFENEFSDMPKGYIKPDTKINEMKEWWDSLNVMITIAFAKMEFGADIEKSDIFDSMTITDLFNNILNKAKKK